MNTIFKDFFSWRKTFLFSATFLLGVTLFSSCKKVESELGKGVQSLDDELGIRKTDTFSLITYTKFQDSVRTDEKGFLALGSYIDPVFGQVTTGFASQLRLQGENPNFGTLHIEGLEVDSVVLSLDYSGSYGTMEAQTFEVYKLNTSIDIDDSLYNFSPVDYDPINLVEMGAGTITPNVEDSVLVGTSMKEAQLRIRLDKSFGEDMINATSAGHLNTDQDFISYFPGVYVTSNSTLSTGEGAIFTFNVIDLDTKITIYYHDDDDPEKEFYFRFGRTSNNDIGYFNKTTFDNTSTAVYHQYENDSTLGMNSFYAQSGLLEARVYVPFFTDLSGKNIAINKADLVLPFEHFDGDPYEPPSSLLIFADDNGTNEVITTDIAEYDGNARNYSVDLTWHMQRVQTGEVTNKEFLLVPNNFFVGANRVILNGPNTANKEKPKMVITYTEY